MVIKNCTRNGCRDVFHASLVKDARFEGHLEFPCIQPQSQIPNRLIAFSKAVGSHDYDQWVHFFEDDCKFERIWNRPGTYLPILKRFNGVISPDFSLYRDMPLVMQQWNTYRSRTIGHWLQSKGVPVIPNVRFGDERSYDFCCVGIAPYGTIVVGSHGCLRSNIERDYFKRGLHHVMSTLEPKTLIVYGAAPHDIFGPYLAQGVKIIPFESAFAGSRKAVIH